MGKPDQEPVTRAGYVLLAGLPNVGKSTLLNALIGENLSIVTSKAQTTWQRVVGIRTDPDTQMIFLDTPGILSADNLFQRSMLAEADRAREEADVAVCLVDGLLHSRGKSEERVFKFFDDITCPKVFAINKIDGASDVETIRSSITERFGTEPLLISAKTGDGLEELLGYLRSNLPTSPFLFPPDELAQAPTRFFVQEMIRETVFEQFEQEIPYSAAVQIDDFREGQKPIYIAATVFVERKSQKGMVVGKKGAAIRRLGADSRAKIEHFLGSSVYLDLWVKVAAGWRRDRKGLKRFGYRVPDELV